MCRHRNSQSSASSIYRCCVCCRPNIAINNKRNTSCGVGTAHHLGMYNSLLCYILARVYTLCRGAHHVPPPLLKASVSYLPPASNHASAHALYAALPPQTTAILAAALLYHHVRCLHPRLQSLHPLHLLWSSVARPSGQPDKTATCDTKEEPAASGGGDGTAIMQQSPLRMAAVGCVPVLLQSRDTLRADMISDNDRTSQHRNADLRYHANCLKLLQLLTFASMQCCMVSQLLMYLL